MCLLWQREEEIERLHVQVRHSILPFHLESERRSFFSFFPLVPKPLLDYFSDRLGDWPLVHIGYRSSRVETLKSPLQPEWKTRLPFKNLRLFPAQHPADRVRQTKKELSTHTHIVTSP